MLPYSSYLYNTRNVLRKKNSTVVLVTSIFTFAVIHASRFHRVKYLRQCLVNAVPSVRQCPQVLQKPLLHPHRTRPRLVSPLVLKARRPHLSLAKPQQPQLARSLQLQSHSHFVSNFISIFIYLSPPE